MKLSLKLAAGAFALIGAVAFQGAIAQNTTTTTTTTTAAAPAATDFPAGPARAVAVRSCTQCHVASQVTSQRKTADQWATTVSQMMGFGAQVSDEEFDPLVTYLATHYGPAK